MAYKVKAGTAVLVNFFDSMTMKNRTEGGVVTWVRADNEVEVEVEKPIRKRVTVPIEDIHIINPLKGMPGQPDTVWKVVNGKWVKS